MLIPFLILLIIYAFQNQKTPKFYYSIIKGVVDFHYFRIAYKTEENKNKIDVLTIAALSLIGLFIYSSGGINFYSNQNTLIECFMVISIVIIYYLIKGSVIKISVIFWVVTSLALRISLQTVFLLSIINLLYLKIRHGRW